MAPPETSRKKPQRCTPHGELNTLAPNVGQSVLASGFARGHVLPLLCWVRGARGPAPCNLEGPREGPLKESKLSHIPCVRANSGKSSTRKIAWAGHFPLGLSGQSDREHFCIWYASPAIDPHWYLRDCGSPCTRDGRAPAHLLNYRVLRHCAKGAHSALALPRSTKF